jgi:hypothetical protein
MSFMTDNLKAVGVVEIAMISDRQAIFHDGI